jgi:hypothetical protein
VRKKALKGPCINNHRCREPIQAVRHLRCASSPKVEDPDIYRRGWICGADFGKERLRRARIFVARSCLIFLSSFGAKHDLMSSNMYRTYGAKDFFHWSLQRHPSSGVLLSTGMRYIIRAHSLTEMIRRSLRMVILLKRSIYVNWINWLKNCKFKILHIVSTMFMNRQLYKLEGGSWKLEGIDPS